MGAHGRGISYQHESSGSGGGSSRLPTPQTGNMITPTHSHTHTHTERHHKNQKDKSFGKKRIFKSNPTYRLPPPSRRKYSSGHVWRILQFSKYPDLPPEPRPGSLSVGDGLIHDGVSEQFGRTTHLLYLFFILESRVEVGISNFAAFLLSHC